MNLSALIAAIASQADDFLGPALDRKHGRAGIEEFVTLEHPEFDALTRKQVTDGVMQVLEAEDFFSTEFVGDPFADDEKESNE
jgi:hypothetical protein